MTEHEQERHIAYHSVTLGALTRAGDALAELVEEKAGGVRSTCALAVPAGLPGERVIIGVEYPPERRAGKRSRRRRHWKPRPPRVWISEILEPSPLRVQPPCPVFGTCGGCQLQHMQYAAQLEWKGSLVEQLLREVGGFAQPPLLPAVGCADAWHYRNHMRFSVNRSGQAGLTARGSHRVLPLTACPIAHPFINTALASISREDNARPQVLMRCGSATRQLLIQPRPRDEVIEQLAAAELDFQPETMQESLAGATFRIRPSSFFQTNTVQAERMAQMVLDGLLGACPSHRAGGISPLTVVDAYCGVGTFARLLAPHVAKVIAIEESASAIKDAHWNVREFANVELLKGKVEELLPCLAQQPDGLIIDPPRAGCQRVVLDALLQRPLARVVYVSCDPATLARDLAILCQQASPTYTLHSVQPLDMFPQTAHVECVAVLERADI
jgi:23S rRNA (uracil1939-C5)-methyltransferase